MDLAAETTPATGLRLPETTRTDAVVIGAGFAGMYMLHRLRELGLGVQVFEAASDVGGTWWWNRYPGARCDIESLDYSYSFDPDLEQEWEWTERYAAQPEILRYANHVADRLDLRRDIQFDTRVLRAEWDESSARWLVVTDCDQRVETRFLITAVGCLSAAKDPEIPGLDTLAGPVHHTGRWPHEGVDFSGLRVGVIGTGSSGIQCIPQIARQARELFVFQRTPNYAQPALNSELDPHEVAAYKQDYPAHRAEARTTIGGVVLPPPEGSAKAATPDERQERYAERWQSGKLFGMLTAFGDIMTDLEANETAAVFVHEQVRSVVDDAEVAERLLPTTYPFGTKRVCLEIDYYATFNQDNVHLVDLRATPIEAVVPEGVQLSHEVIELDALVLATGFDAMTGALLAIDIIGKHATSLRAKWADGPHTYLGLAMSGFPNLFTITGPGSPSVLTNMMVSIEQHVEWIAACIERLDANHIETIEADPDAEAEWCDQVQVVASFTLYPQADSWYMGANVPGKPRLFMPYVGGVASYRAICDEVADDGYRGFTLNRAHNAGPFDPSPST